MHVKMLACGTKVELICANKYFVYVSLSETFFCVEQLIMKLQNDLFNTLMQNFSGIEQVTQAYYFL